MSVHYVFGAQSWIKGSMGYSIDRPDSVCVCVCVCVCVLNIWRVWGLALGVRARHTAWAKYM